MRHARIFFIYFAIIEEQTFDGFIFKLMSE